MSTPTERISIPWLIARGLTVRAQSESMGFVQLRAETEDGGLVSMADVLFFSASAIRPRSGAVVEITGNHGAFRSARPWLMPCSLFLSLCRELGVQLKEGDS